MKTFDELWKFINTRGSIITVQEYHELEHVFDLMQACECQSYLEVGTAEGNSLYVLGHAVANDGWIDYVDYGEEHTQAPREESIAKLNPFKIASWIGDSTNPNTLPDKDVHKFDCILIDGGHDFATVLSDSILYAPLATKYVFWHDIQLPEVRAACDWFKKRWAHLGEFSDFINSDSFGYRILKVKS